MSSSHHIHGLWTAFVCVLVMTIAAVSADQLQLLSGLRLILHDALSPGRLVVAAIPEISRRPDFAKTRDLQLQSYSAQFQEMQQDRRALLIENAQLHNRLRQLTNSKGYSNRHPELAGFDLVPARVLSRYGMPSLLRQAMIDAGKSHRLTQSQLVLDTHGILLDRGTRNGVSEGRRALTGSVVLGRIDRVGHWVSQLIPVTDQSYSARVRLVRRSTQVTQMGAEGMLEGTGSSCHISGVPDTASVAVGDEVFSADIEGMTGPHLYYGTVVSAGFESAAGWSIVVKPAIQISDVEDVSVLVPSLTAGRSSAPD